MSLYALPKNPHEHSLFRDYKLCMQPFVATDKIFVATVCKQNAPRWEVCPLQRGVFCGVAVTSRPGRG